MGPDRRELLDFLEHVDNCTTAAIIEPLPLATRPIVSIDGLRPYLTTERLRSLLLYVGSPDGYEDIVRTRYLAVFSILLSINQGIYLPTFVQYDHMADEGLPFLTCDAWPEVSKTIFNEFYEAQWRFCPKRFMFGQLHDTWLHKDIVVPLKEKEILDDGVDSIIFKIELFEEYNHLIPDTLNIPPTNVFILKSSRSDYAKLHNNEVEAYRTLLSHPSGRDAMQNMARFYGSWRQGETRNILREYIGGGTLANFFERTEPPTTMIFLVDDSASMKPYWKEVQRVFEALAYLVKHMDPDGIELHFANSPEHKGRSKDRKSLTKKFERVKPYGQCQMGIALSNILPLYYQNSHQKSTSKRSSLSLRVEEKPPVNIYILTDGVWSPESYCVSTIQAHITNLVNNLWKAGKLQHVGIQFIRFGNDVIGKQRLDYLDNDNLQHYTVPMDIVDTEPSTGNVFKMLLASTDPSWDNDEDELTG
ncbi:hypothetical protein J4E91_006044 [Alternaria rosae]|nr:hypothetical protein J4E91_006044 [Alternaria rosae]